MQLEAIYQGDGILRLFQPLDLPEGEKVLVDIANARPLLNGDYLDTDYHWHAEQNVSSSVTLEQVRKALSKIEGSIEAVINAEREERF